MWGRSLVMINTVQNLYHRLHSPVLTSVVTATEQQAVARILLLTSYQPKSTRCSLTVMVLVVVRGAGVEVPQ